MNILYIGDIMGEAGIKTVENVLSGIVDEHSVDIVIAQAENVSDGKGLTIVDFERLRIAGVNAFTGGNHTMSREETYELLEDELLPITRPANYPVGTPGKQFKYLDIPTGKILIVSLLGQVVGKSAEQSVDNPLKVIDEILASQIDIERVGTIVNFHGDFSSEKRVIGHYLDGRVTAVIGDHWHVPTADAAILPKGTAHITDVGMCGSLHSSLGVKFESIIPRWRDGDRTQNELETEGPMQFNAVLIKSDPTSHHALSIRHIQKIV